MESLKDKGYSYEDVMRIKEYFDNEIANATRLEKAFQKDLMIISRIKKDSLRNLEKILNSSDVQEGKKNIQKENKDLGKTKETRLDGDKSK